MVDQKLRDYIKQNINKMGPDGVRKALRESGWPENQINEVLQEYSASSTPLAPTEKAGGKGKRKIMIVSLVIIAVAIVIAYFLIIGFPEFPPGDEDQLPPPPTTTPTGIGISPASSSAGVGDTVTIEITASDSQSLFGFQFNLNYDPAILSFVSISEGSFLNNNGQDSTFCVNADTSTTGLIKNYACTRLKGPSGAVGVSGSGTLVTVTFSAVAPGTSSIALSNVKLSDEKAQSISSEITSGQIVIE
jgi:hypothetical protein